jgi:type I restriction enzyme M protein
VDVMVAVGPEHVLHRHAALHAVVLRIGARPKDPRADTVLFIDARHIYRQVDRAHRDWTPAQIGFIANLVRLYRGEAPDFTLGGEETAAKLKEVFGDAPTYADVPGLCKAATLAEIEAQGWSLNPGRYVGVAAGEERERRGFLNEELGHGPDGGRTHRGTRRCLPAEHGPHRVAQWRRAQGRCHSWPRIIFVKLRSRN